MVWQEEMNKGKIKFEIQSLSGWREKLIFFFFLGHSVLSNFYFLGYGARLVEDELKTRSQQISI